MGPSLFRTWRISLKAAKLRSQGWKKDTIADTLQEWSRCVAPIARIMVSNLRTFHHQRYDGRQIAFAVEPDPEGIFLLNTWLSTRISQILQRHGGDIPSRAALLAEAISAALASRRPGVTPKASVEKQPSGYVLSARFPTMRSAGWRCAKMARPLPVDQC